MPTQLPLPDMPTWTYSKKPVRPLPQLNASLSSKQLRLSDIKMVAEHNPFKLGRHYDRGERGLTATQIIQRAWATEAIERGDFRHDPRTEVLIPYLQRMMYDDALVCRDWRLELLYIGTGLPHFRLYWQGHCFGVAGIYASHADLGTSRNIALVRRMLAAFLVLCGWTEEEIEIRPGKARTRLTANTDHQYRLFKARAIRKPAPRYDVFRERELA